MIVCKLELWPGGIEEAAEHLGTIRITNNIIGSVQSGGKRGDYGFSLQKKIKKTWMKGKVTNYPRLSYHPWNLVREILNQAADRNGGRI